MVPDAQVYLPQPGQNQDGGVVPTENQRRQVAKSHSASRQREKEGGKAGQAAGVAVIVHETHSTQT